MEAGTGFGTGGEDEGIGREGGTIAETGDETGRRDGKPRGGGVEKEGQTKGRVQTNAMGQMGELKCFDMLYTHTNIGTCTR